MNLEKTVVPRPALDLGYESAHRRSMPGLKATFGDAAAFCVQVDDKRAPLHPSGHCDDQCPPCRSGSGARCAEASRSSGAGRRRLPARSRGRTEAPSLEFSEGVEPRFSGVTVNAAGGGDVPLGQTKVRNGPPRGVGHANRQVVLTQRLRRPLASSFGRLPSHPRNLSVHRPMNDSPQPHVFERTTEQTETRFSS